MDDFMKEIDDLLANESDVNVDDLALEGANLEVFKKIKEANKELRETTKEARKLAKAANYSSAIAQYNKAIGIAKKAKSEIAAIPDSTASNVISAFISGNLNYITSQAALYAKDNAHKKTNNWTKKDAILSCDRFVQLCENEIDLLKQKVKKLASESTVSIDEAFEAIMNDTNEDNSVNNSLESILTEADIVNENDADDDEFDFSDVADEAMGDRTEGLYDPKTIAGNKSRWETLKKAISTFWSEKIVKTFRNIKESFGTKVASLKGKKFTMNVKKWGIWNKLVGVWQKLSKKRASEAKAEVVEAVKHADNPDSSYNQDTTAQDSLIAIEAMGERTPYAEDPEVKKLEAELAAPETPSDGKKEVDGNVISRVIGTILGAWNSMFSAFKNIPTVLASKVQKGEKSEKDGKEGVFSKIAKAIKSAISAVGGFFSFIYHGATGLLAKVGRVFHIHKASKDDSYSQDTSTYDSWLEDASEFDSALEGLFN